MKGHSVPFYSSHFRTKNRPGTRCNFTRIEGPEVSLHTVLQEAAQWLDVGDWTFPFCEEVLNHVMNCLGPR